MGVVEDVRSVLQDFLAPQLRELRVRIDVLENQQKEFRADVNKRFDSVDARFERLETKLAERHEQLVTEIRRTATIHDLVERVARLESERPPAH